MVHYLPLSNQRQHPHILNFNYLSHAYSKTEIEHLSGLLHCDGMFAEEALSKSSPSC